MTEHESNSKTDSSASHPASLPKRDYVLLPLLGLATILFMLGASEILTRLIWTARGSNACMDRNSMVGPRFKPNCTIRTKNAEGPWITDHYNECGYRSATSCGPKPLGTIRIAILGSSVSAGLNVPYERTYFALISSELSRIYHRPVDVQNLGVPASSPIYAYRRVGEALALKPDVVLYFLTPFDVELQIDPKELVERNNSTRTASTRAVHSTVSPMKWLDQFLIQSRTALVAQHFLFQNKNTYLRLYMTSYGDKADFLRQPFTHAWQQRFADLDLVIGDMATKLHAAGVPLVVIPVPSRAEAALLSSRPWPPHVDPFAFGRQIKMIASKHGAGYVDLMEAFSRLPDSEQLFYVVDQHVTAEGQKVIAQNLSRKLQDGCVRAFSHSALQQSIGRED